MAFDPTPSPVALQLDDMSRAIDWHPLMGSSRSYRLTVPPSSVACTFTVRVTCCPATALSGVAATLMAVADRFGWKKGSGARDWNACIPPASSGYPGRFPNASK